MRIVTLSTAGLMIAATVACEHSTASSAPATASRSAAAQPAPAPTPNAVPAVATDATAPSAEPDAASDELRDHHRHHHHGGVTMFIAMSIETLGVPAGKEAKLEQIQRTLHEQMKPAREAERKVLAAIADGVAAGQIRSAELSAAIEDEATAANQVHEASADALNQLHALLSPVEREALVDKVNAHWQVWRKVNADEEHDSRAKDARLTRLAVRLNLSQDQVERISKALKASAPAKPDPALAEAHVQAFMTAFASNSFDAHRLNQGAAANAHLARVGTKRMIHFYEVVTPVLTPEQRTQLANHLRERLNDAHAVSMNN
jgi:Spy/CpxP family protein refolding chaperone